MLISTVRINPPQTQLKAAKRLKGNNVANIKSQKKRILTNEKAHMRNKSVKSELHTLTRKVEDAVAEGDAEKAQTFAASTCKKLDKAVSKGVIHKNQAANRKSGITKLAGSIEKS
jgi:small subunit ribosomal protein S20